MREEFEVDSEFANDEEAEEVLDALVKYAEELIEAGYENKRVQMIDPIRVSQQADIYKVLNCLFENVKEVKVKCSFNEPFTSVGYVSITGKI